METMTRREELESIFWDMYKDAYGFRPRGISTHLWDEDKFNREFDFLQSEITKNEGLRKIAEHEAAHAFESVSSLYWLAVLRIVLWPCVGSTRLKAATVTTSSCAT